MSTRIEFACSCGKQLRLSQAASGGEVICPGCSRRLRVPEWKDTSLAWDDGSDEARKESRDCFRSRYLYAGILWLITGCFMGFVFLAQLGAGLVPGFLPGAMTIISFLLGTGSLLKWLLGDRIEWD